MSDPRNLRDPALGGDPALDPVASGPSRRSMRFGGAWWLLAILVAFVIAAGFWGYGGYGRRNAGDGMVNGGAAGGGNTAGGTPVLGGAAPTNAPMPSAPGNGSGR